MKIGFMEGIGLKSFGSLKTDWPENCDYLLGIIRDNSYFCLKRI